MPELQGMQGGVPDVSQTDNNIDNPFAPPVEPAVSEPQDVFDPISAGIMGVPDVPKPPVQEAPPKKDNDQVRYEYWQAEADRRKNEALRIEAEKQALASQNMQLMQMLQQGQRQAQQEESKPKPPTAPVRPKEPRNFNREEALTDPKSESAIYLDNLDNWRSEMDNYNSQILDYERNTLASERAQYEAYMQQVAQQQQMQAQYAEAERVLQQQYRTTPDQAREFVQLYSDPRNVTMDNLVAMYQASKGIAPQVPAQPQPMFNPSPSFQQTMRAQQVVPPMGVMPAQPPTAQAEIGNAFMDALIGGQTPKGIFGT